MQWFGLALGKKRVYYTTQEASFRIPFVRKLIRFLRAIPIPTENKYKSDFANALDEILQNGNIVHFYPEASLFPYCNSIRDFKSGAFRFAIQNDVPIIPIIFTFNNPTGLRKLFKRKQDVTLTILNPIKYVNHSDNYRKDINDFKSIIHKDMAESL